MKHFYLLLLLVFGTTIYAQDFSKEWQKVYELEKAGSYKTALEKVESFYVEAVKNKDEVEILKTFFYKQKLSERLEIAVTVIPEIEKEINLVSEPTKPFYYLIAANELANELLKNPYEIKKRKETATKLSEKQKTEWTIDDYLNEIKRLHDLTFANTTLNSSLITPYKNVISIKDEQNGLFETYFEFFAMEWINLYHSLENEGLTSSQENYTLSNYILDLTDQFYQHNFSGEGLQAINLYQRLEKHYLDKQNNYLFDKIRYTRLKNYGFHVNEEVRYQLNDYFIENAKTKLFIDKVWFDMAYSHIHNRTEESFAKANELVNALLEKNPDQFIANDALQLKSEIHKKSISLIAPKYSHSNEYIKMLANYRNIDTLYAALYEVTDDKIFNSIDNTLDFDEYRKQNNLKQVINFFPMRNFQKYVENSTEIFIPKQQQGNYILAYNQRDFTKNHTINNVNFVKFKVTNVVVLNKIKDRTIEFLFYDRATGKPLKNTKVKINGKRFTTNNDGKISKKKSKLTKEIDRYNYTNIEVAVFNNGYIHNETFSTRNFNYFYDADNENEEENNIQIEYKIFTDRGLYRPNNEVNFKGIVFSEYEYKPSQVLKNTRFKLIVEDNSYDEIYSVDVTTNDLGSFSGSFKIPYNVSLGRCKIYLEKPNDLTEVEKELWKGTDFYKEEFDIWVEEYKRPTFQVSTNNFTETITPNHSFLLSGQATSFTKSPIANAKVTAKITVSKAYFNLNSETINYPEIITYTKADGSFEVPFKGVFSAKDQTENKPYHTYSFEIIVQDQTGEVQTATKNVHYSYNDLDIKMNTVDYLENTVPAVINLSAKTANGKPQKVNGTLKIIFTNDYETYTKKRLWLAPANQLLNEATFKQLFPYEDFLSNLQTEKPEVYSKEIEIDGDAEIIIPTTNWKSGYYEVLFYPNEKHQYNFPIRKSITLQIREKYKHSEEIVHLSINIDESNKENKLVLNSLSEFDDVFVAIEIIDAKGNFKEKNFEVKKGKSSLVLDEIDFKSLTRPVQMQYQYVYDNRMYQQYIEIPYRITNTNNWIVNAEQINNKLTPSQPYHWKFKIASASKNIFNGEVLASMYVVSLDNLVENENLSYWDFSRTHTIKSRYDLPKITYDELVNYSITDFQYYQHFDNLEFGSHILFNTLNWFGYGSYERKNEYDKFLKSQVDNKQKEGFVSSNIVDYDSGEYMPNVKVTNVTTGKHVFTNQFGAFSIEAKPMDEITLQHEDFITQKLFGKNIVSRGDLIQMFSSESLFLDQIVVDTYRTYIDKNPNVPIRIYDEQFKEVREDYIKMLRQTFTNLNVSSQKSELQGYNRLIIQTTNEIRPLILIDGIPVSLDRLDLNEVDIAKITAYTNIGATAIYGNRGTNGAIMITTKKAENNHEDIVLRKKLQETAFFYPHLKTSSDGSFEVEFNAPESLTEWKFRAMAHNNLSELAYFDYNVTTQKDVMIQPNMPRFVRETDVVVLKARVSNTTSLPLQATAVLRLFNTVTGEDLTDKIIKTDKLVPTTINGLSANTVSWSVEIPKDIEGLQYRISVKAGNFTDGEESVIPVLSNRTLITETAPIWQLGKQNKDYKLDNLVTNSSQTLKNHQFVVEISHNATWLTMQSLPYLYDFQHTCNEQIFAKYFADVLAMHVLEKNPNIKDLIAEWRNNPKAKLEENEELKQLMLQETPWMKDLVSDDEKKAQLASYFDMDRLEKEADEIVKTLGERQNASGGFGWFSGGSENDYITQHILVTAAQLDKLGISHFNETDVKNIVNKAHRFIDVKMQDQLKIANKSFSNQAAINYAFVKSYYSKDFAIPADVSKKLDQNFIDLKKNWVELSLQNKAKLAIILNRKGDTTWAKQILNQLNESAVIDETYGMYWKENSNEHYYYFNAAEVQALIIEAFKEVDNNETTLQKLNAWLLSQKLNKDWGTTKATTSAIYALLLSNATEIIKSDKAVVSVGNQTIKTNETAENQTDEVLGYQTYQWKADEITNDFGKISIKNRSEKPVFGGIYWQYFEDFNVVKDANNGILKIARKFYIENSDKKLQEISNETELKLGQKVIIRLEITAEKDMEFIHIKDMRAATFEPVDVLSGYKYENNLHFYQSTRDAATNFFIDYLSKGSYVIDYEVRLNNQGSFTSGISTIQSMYAPEHTGHTAGKTIKVE